MRPWLALALLLGANPAQAQGNDAALARMVDAMGADVSGDALLSASFTGVHLDLDEDGSRLRLALDGGAFGLGSDLRRLDFTVSAPIDGSQAHGGPGGHFRDAIQLGLRFTLIRWNVGESRRLNTLDQDNCEHFKRAAGIRDWCTDEIYAAHIDQLAPPDFAGDAAALARNRDILLREYEAAQALFQASARVGCVREVSVPPAGLDPDWLDLMPPTRAIEARDCAQASRLQAWRLALDGGHRRVENSADENGDIDEAQLFPWSAFASYGLALGTRASVSLGLGYQRAHDSGELALQCAENGNGEPLCREVVLGAEAASESGVGVVDLRYGFSSGLAVKLVARHAWDDAVTRVSLPVYFFGGMGQRYPDGGIAVDWDSRSDEARVRLFIGQSFAVAGL